MIVWSVDLSKFTLKFESRGLMKTKIYVDFLIEPPQRKERHECWSLTTDRFSNKKCGGVEVILESLDDITLEQVV